MISGPSPIIPGLWGFKKLRKSLILCGMGWHICSAGFAGFVRLNWFAFVAWSLVRHPQCPNDDQIYLAFPNATNILNMSPIYTNILNMPIYTIASHWPPKAWQFVPIPKPYTATIHKDLSNKFYSFSSPSSETQHLEHWMQLMWLISFPNWLFTKFLCICVSNRYYLCTSVFVCLSFCVTVTKYKEK